MALGVKENEIVLDLCSALEERRLQLLVYEWNWYCLCLDMYENRVQLIKDGQKGCM